MNAGEVFDKDYEADLEAERCRRRRVMSNRHPVLTWLWNVLMDRKQTFCPTCGTILRTQTWGMLDDETECGDYWHKETV